MEPITVIASAIASELIKVGKRLVKEGVVSVPLEPAKKGLDRFVQRQYDEKIGEDKALRKAVETALAEAGAPIGDEDDLRQSRSCSIIQVTLRSTSHVLPK